MAGGETTALHPPLYPFMLAGLSLLGIDTPQGHRLLGAAAGTVLVVLAGLLARRVGGERAGVVAAAVTAVYPTLIRADASLLTETVYAPILVGILLLAFRLRDRPTPRNALLLGALIGVGALGRVEALMLVPLLVVPLAWRIGPRRLAIGGLAVAATVAVLTPWLVRNWIVFDKTPRIASNADAVIAGANCPRTYASGEDLGGWRIECVRPRMDLDEPTRYGVARREGIDYALDHVDRWPAVVSARLLRTWGLRGSKFGDGFDATSTFLRTVGHALFFPLAALAVYGVVLLRRRGTPFLILLAPVALATLATTLGWGLPRFRHPAEVPIVVLASVAVVALADRLQLDDRLRRLRAARAERASAPGQAGA
jgi:hypothetical protein